MPNYATDRIIRLLALSLAFLLNSCSHYSVRVHDSLPFKSLYLNTVINESYAPNIQALFQNQLRQVLLEQTPITLSKSADMADVQLDLRLIQYERAVRSRTSSDPGRFNALNLTIGVELTLYDRINDSYLIEKSILISSEPIFFDRSNGNSNLNEREYEALPRISRKLAEAVMNQILSHWD